VLSGRDILKLTTDMDQWLYFIPHRWSTGFDTTRIWIVDSTAALAGGLGPRGHWMDIATYISFTHTEDLLAFRLAWGIHA